MIKTIIKHFIFERCLDITFTQIISNFIKPDMTNERVRRYIHTINKHFSDYSIVDISVVSLDGKTSRYADVEDLLAECEGKYYKTVKFTELASMGLNA